MPQAMDELGGKIDEGPFFLDDKSLKIKETYILIKKA